MSEPTYETGDAAIAWFATKGSGTNEATRIRELLDGVGPLEEICFDKTRKRESFFQIIRQARTRHPRLMVMEGTGLAGGVACLLARLCFGVPFVFSSGDAVGPFVGSHRPGVGWIFGLYERLLYRWCAGFIGWTPYLTGRAMTLGASRAMTAPGWVLGHQATPLAMAEARATIRARYGIAEGEIVFGIVGALEWNGSKQYCYGLELVEALKRVDRPEIKVMIVGGGSGYEKLKSLAGAHFGTRVIMPGPVALDAVMSHLAAFDVASLPQSMDPVGMFRYTTKISEYAMARLPVVTSRIPMAYDLDRNWIWRLPGNAPWGETYIAALAEWMAKITPHEIAAARGRIELLPADSETFDADLQKQRVTAFITELLADLHATPNS